MNANQNRINQRRKRSTHTLLDGHSRAIQEVSTLIESVANSSSTVLIRGESGTGKELVARSIHMMSNRRDQNFVPVNCAAIPQELLESELFGHKKGSFTGAITNRIGRFEIADNGTLFLDEIGDMNIQMQAKLLRVLQENMIDPIGSTKSRKINIRVVAATHRNLEKMVENGEFREDLFYRLNIFPIDVPPLRRRAEDLPLLINIITEKIKNETNRNVNISTEAMLALSQHVWPGNVRELSNLLERLSILYPNRQISINDLPHEFSKFSTNTTDSYENIIRKQSNSTKNADSNLAESIGKDNFNLKKILEEIEINYIEQALQISNGVVANAAKNLGLRRTTLVEKIKKYKIKNIKINQPITN